MVKGVANQRTGSVLLEGDGPPFAVHSHAIATVVDFPGVFIAVDANDGAIFPEPFGAAFDVHDADALPPLVSAKFCLGATGGA